MADPIVNIDDDQLINVDDDELVAPQQYQPPTVLPGQSVMSAGIPAQARFGVDPGIENRERQKARLEAQTSVGSNAMADKVRAFVGGAAPYVAPAVDAANHLAGVVKQRFFDGQGPERDLDIINLKANPDSATSQTERAMVRNPGAAIIGGITDPAVISNRLLNVPGKVAMGAAQGAIRGGVAADQVGQDPVSGVKMGAVVGGALPLASQAAQGVLEWASKKYTPAALTMIRQMADKILTSKASINGQQKTEMVNAPSKLGFKNYFDDILYTVITKLDPQALQSTYARTNKLADAVLEQGANVGAARQPIRDQSVRAGDYVTDMSARANELRSSVRPEITAGPQASQILEGDFVRQARNTNSDAMIPLEQIDRKRSQVRSDQYEPAFAASNPQAAKTQATDEVQSYLRSKITPQQSAAIDAANESYKRTSDVQDIFMNNASRIGSGMTQNSIKGQVRGYLGSLARQQGAPIVYSGAQKTARKAIGILESRYGDLGIDLDRAPLEIESVKAKLNALSQMDPKDIPAFTYAESMLNPLFRRVWLKAQENKDE